MDSMITLTYLSTFRRWRRSAGVICTRIIGDASRGSCRVASLWQKDRSLPVWIMRYACSTRYRRSCFGRSMTLVLATSAAFSATAGHVPVARCGRDLRLEDVLLFREQLSDTELDGMGLGRITARCSYVAYDGVPRRISVWLTRTESGWCFTERSAADTEDSFGDAAFLFRVT